MGTPKLLSFELLGADGFCEALEVGCGGRCAFSCARDGLHCLTSAIILWCSAGSTAGGTPAADAILAVCFESATISIHNEWTVTSLISSVRSLGLEPGNDNVPTRDSFTELGIVPKRDKLGRLCEPEGCETGQAGPRYVCPAEQDMEEPGVKLPLRILNCLVRSRVGRVGPAS